MEVPTTKSRVIFDPIYGFIKLTPMEWEIIHSPFYQRLRWIKQLGFSFYVFPGAEHSRFGHSIGVMFNAHKILESCGLAVSESELMDVNSSSKDAVFHKSLRLGALLHDLGTFCFSHTTETAYIAFGETQKSRNGKTLKDDHENLGSFIIKNTDYDGGITQIIKKYGLNPQMISDLVKGVDPSVLANQILHSEIDCDRMDYLLRDAYYTGLKYGSYDREYLLYHFQVEKIQNHRILTIKHNALHCVEDFLMARFAWYSQVIRSARGSKYDAIAERLTYFFLEKGWVYRYSDLLEMIENEPMMFFQFNDTYFISAVHQRYMDGSLDKEPGMKDLAKILLLESGAKTVRSVEFNQILISQNEGHEREKIMKRAQNKIDQMQHILKEKGTKADWMIGDLPKKDIIFVRSPKNIVKDTQKANVLLERDPVKISTDDGEVKLLAEVENSIISKLHDSTNFVPNVFCSESAYKLLKDEGAIE
jgi:HD superfamily phosphohydrolase